MTEEVEEVKIIEYDKLIIPEQQASKNEDGTDFDYAQRNTERERWTKNEYAEFIKFDADKSDLETFEALFTLQHGGNGFRNKLSKIASRTYQPEKGRTITPNIRLRLDAFNNSEVLYKGYRRIRFEPYNILIDNFSPGSWSRDGDDYGRLYRQILKAYTDYGASGYNNASPVRLKKYDELVEAFDPQTHKEVGVTIPGVDNDYWSRNTDPHGEDCEICPLLISLKSESIKVNKLIQERENKKKQYAESLESPSTNVFRIPYGKDGVDFTYLPDVFKEHYKKISSTTGRKRRKPAPVIDAPVLDVD